MKSYLQVPKEEGEDEADAEAHKPGHQQEGYGLRVLELLQHRHPLRHLARRLSEHLHTDLNNFNRLVRLIECF